MPVAMASGTANWLLVAFELLSEPNLDCSRIARP
jgi:hypothetical protein